MDYQDLYFKCQESRERIASLLAESRTKLFEQDLRIQDLQVQSDAMRRTIGELRAKIARQSHQH